MKKFEGLLRSEIKKIEKFAQKRDGKDSRLTGYGYPETEGAMGFITVKCEICSNDMRMQSAAYLRGNKIICGQKKMEKKHLLLKNI